MADVGRAANIARIVGAKGPMPKRMLDKLGKVGGGGGEGGKEGIELCRCVASSIGVSVGTGPTSMFSFRRVLFS